MLELEGLCVTWARYDGEPSDGGVVREDVQRCKIHSVSDAPFGLRVP